MKHPGIVFAYLQSELPHQATFYSVSYPQDLTKNPSEGSSIALDSERESVVLPGEPLTIIEEQDRFVRVQAWWQPKWNCLNERFEPYKGWIQRDAIEELEVHADWRLVTSHQAVIRSKPSFDAPVLAHLPMAALYKKTSHQQADDPAWHLLQVEGSSFFVHDKDVSEWDWLEDCDEDFLRWQWRQGASRMKGLSYVLGGLRTEQSTKSRSRVLQGIDCSGLIILSARRMGLVIPRDAKDQYRYCFPVDLTDVKPGDLVFLGQESTDKIDHVIMQEEMGYWLESSRNYPSTILHASESRRLKPGEKVWAASVKSFLKIQERGE